MSVFDRLDRLTSRAIDQQFASAFVCTSLRAAPNGRPISDDDRLDWEGVGILVETPADAPIDVGARNRSNDFRSMVTGHSYELSVDRIRHPAADRARQGDAIAIGEREFQVQAVRRDGLSRVVFGLGLLATACEQED